MFFTSEPNLPFDSFAGAVNAFPSWEVVLSTGKHCLVYCILNCNHHYCTLSHLLILQFAFLKSSLSCTYRRQGSG